MIKQVDWFPVVLLIIQSYHKTKTRLKTVFQIFYLLNFSQAKKYHKSIIVNPLPFM